MFSYVRRYLKIKKKKQKIKLKIVAQTYAIDQMHYTHIDQLWSVFALCAIIYTNVN